jgi:hypothetical protein
MSFLETFWSSLSSSVVFWAAIWWLGLCGVTAWLAHRKGQNPTGFFAIAFFFSPVIGLLALIAARDLRSVSDAQTARDDFRQMLGPLLLQIDGIRGHLAVSRETQRMAPPPPPPPPESPATQSRQSNVAAPPEAAKPRPEPALINSGSAS